MRWREDGTLEFLGRIDQQVKLRGFRIELGEIEAVLDAHHDVSAAVAVVREDTPGDQRLVAYVGARRMDAPWTREQLRASVQGAPAAVHGAVGVRVARRVPGDRERQARSSRAAGPRRLAPRPGAHLRAAARHPSSRSLAVIWSEILGVDRIGLDDDFFDLGGHSLLAVKMLSRVQESFDLDLFLYSVLEHSTVRELAAMIAARAPRRHR